jgi:hypothetical protein
MRRNHFGFLIIAALLAAATACSAGDASPGTAGQTALRTGASAVAAASRTGAPVAAAAAAKPAKRIDVLSASFASASTGWLLAELPCSHQVHPCRTTVLMRETTDGGRTWFAAPAPPALPVDMFQSSPPAGGVGGVLFTSARDGWAFGPGLWRTTNGGASWRRLPEPCAGANWGALAAAGGWLFLGCGGEPGAGSQLKSAYVSRMTGASGIRLPARHSTGTWMARS